ncbi:MAG TPA: hypothetical protein PLC52_01925 [Anaerolineales bacterium]|nr:hypothetical protein [Anaerolineales bacterium]HRQ91611.1 hypothetical protein [Anaerolineales bacterium]
MKNSAKPKRKSIFAKNGFLGLMRFDYLGRALFQIYGDSFWKSFAFSGLLAILIFCLLGGYISWRYHQLGYDVLSTFETKERWITLAQVVINPVLWAAYTWQIVSTPKIFATMNNNSVVIGRRKAFEKFGSILKHYYNQRWILPFVLASTVTALLVWFETFSAPNSLAFFGHQYHWILINQYYFLLLWIPYLFISVYMGCFLIVRMFLFAQAVQKFFKLFTISPIPFHPDGGNGLGSVGDYALKITYLFIIFALFIPFWIYFPATQGSEARITYDTVAMLIAYIVTVPAVFIPPVWAAHLALKTHRDKELQATAKQIKIMLRKQSQKTLDKHFRNYEIKEIGYQNWPFAFSRARILSLTAILPLLPSLYQSLVDLLKQITNQVP